MREKVALVLGMVGGFILAQLVSALRGEPNTCACRECRQDRWRRGKDSGEDGALRSMPDGAESCPRCGTARKGGIVGLHACRPS